VRERRPLEVIGIDAAEVVVPKCGAEAKPPRIVGRPRGLVQLVARGVLELGCPRRTTLAG